MVATTKLPKRVFKIPRACLKLALFLLFVAAVLFDTAQWIGGWSLVPRLFGVVMVVFMAHRYTDRTFKEKIRTSHHASVFAQVEEKRARQLQEEIRGASLITLDQAEVFTRAIVETTKLHQRIVEEYRPQQRTLLREVTIDVQIPRRIMRRAIAVAGPDATEATFLYPVVVPPKSVFYDDLRVYAAGGEKLTTLSYREYLHVAASVVNLLLASACDTPPAELPADAVQCERDAVWGIIRRVDGRPTSNGSSPRKAHEDSTPTGRRERKVASREPTDQAFPIQDGHAQLGEIGQQKPSTMEVEDAGRELARTIQTLKTVSSDADRRRAIRMAAQFVEVLSTHYAIVTAVSVPASGRFAIRYECTLIPELDLAPRIRPERSTPSFMRQKLRTLKTHLYILLSTRPIDVKVSLDNAWTCQSYHVLVRCPDGLYLSQQQLVVPDHYLERSAMRAPTPPHVRFRRRLGQPYAHFYARFLPTPRRASTDGHGNIVRPAEKAPKLLLHFHEVPPGSVCRAALAAIASTVLVWVIGYGFSHDPSGILSTEAPVLLLAFPGVAASWLGFEGDTRLFDGTLTARLSLACTAAVSLLATGLYVLHHQAAVTGVSGTTHSLHAGRPRIGVLGVTQWPWAALTVVGLFNASYLSYRWGINSWRFRHLADRPDPAGLVAKVRQEHDDEDDAVHTSPASAAPGAKPRRMTAEN